MAVSEARASRSTSLLTTANRKLADNPHISTPMMLSTGPNVRQVHVPTGIGWGITKVLITKGLTVFGSVRQQSDADRLQREFGEAFAPLIMDVTDRQAVERAAAQVSAQLGSSTLAGLVNNAGIVVPGPLLHLPLEEYRRQLEVNLTDPLSVTQVFAPLLGADLARQGAAGRIINIGSTAGKIGIPFMGAYVASKHGLEGMSEAPRREMMIYGIDVIMIVPGPVATPIWDKGRLRPQRV
jgi:NAD(P)-dependent dehydrogenase (short-subunit alcohol dehydrogenase family)